MKYLLNKHNGDEFLALKEYKGSIVNLKPVYRVLENKKKLEKIKELYENFSSL